MKTTVSLSILVLNLMSVFLTVGQQSEYVRANYDKSEYKIPMRDGVHLHTVVYSPKDQSKKYPILMQRTPYSAGPYGEDKFRPSISPSSALMKDGYIVVYQDVRGRWMSEGTYDNMRPTIPARDKKSKAIDESTDTYDTIEWLLKNLKNHNSRVVRRSVLLVSKHRSSQPVTKKVRAIVMKIIEIEITYGCLW